MCNIKSFIKFVISCLVQRSSDTSHPYFSTDPNTRVSLDFNDRAFDTLFHITCYGLDSKAILKQFTYRRGFEPEVEKKSFDSDIQSKVVVDA